MPQPALEPGDLIADKYRLEKQLGRGGMGAVFLASDTELERQVAIKVLLDEHAADQGAVARFLREAKASAKIQSEHVARVYETGKLASGVPFIAMEYLEGEDLATRLEASGKFGVSEIADYVLQVCQALAEAHAAGIVHRDLKPANLFLALRADGERVLKILDFGISKISTSSVLTKSQTLVGSPYYMSPEQLESAQDVDARADIWALGVIMYELYAGKRPFEGNSLAALCVSVLNAAPEPLGATEDATERSFYAVVERCLQKDRKLRYQNVGELAAALERLRPRESFGAAARVTKVLQNARTVPDLPRRESDAAQERSSSWAQTNRGATLDGQRGRKLALTVVVLLAAAGIGVGLGQLVQRPTTAPAAEGRGPEPAPPARSVALAPASPAPVRAGALAEAPEAARPAPIASVQSVVRDARSESPEPSASPARVSAPQPLTPKAAKRLANPDSTEDPARDPFLRRH